LKIPLSAKMPPRPEKTRFDFQKPPVLEKAASILRGKAGKNPRSPLNTRPLSQKTEVLGKFL
jgi:hypothetical protein